MSGKLLNRCKFCRRAGEKLFLKGQKCFTNQCPITRRTYGPGMHGNKPKRMSEYGSQLLEKQKLEAIYALTNRQLHKYFSKAVRIKGKTTESLLSMLERRLDNVVFRIGLAESRKMARKYVRDKHFSLNGKKISIPSIMVAEKDILSINSKKVKIYNDKPVKDWPVPAWIKWDNQSRSATILHLPTLKDIDSKIDIAKIIEFYSR